MSGSEANSDVVFLVGEEPEVERIPAHSWVLSDNSPVFRAMFVGPLSQRLLAAPGQSSAPPPPTFQPTVHVDSDGGVTTSLTPIPELEEHGAGASAAATQRARKEGLPSMPPPPAISSTTPKKKCSLSKAFPVGKTTIAVTDIADSKAFDILLR